jgi:hypothetical protein
VVTLQRTIIVALTQADGIASDERSLFPGSPVLPSLSVWSSTPAWVSCKREACNANRLSVRESALPPKPVLTPRSGNVSTVLTCQNKVLQYPDDPSRSFMSAKTMCSGIIIMDIHIETVISNGSSSKPGHFT